MEEAFLSAPNHEMHGREAIGSIMYAMTGTRPDIAQSVGSFYRFSEKSKLPQWIGVKRILLYLKDTSSIGIVYDEPEIRNWLAISTQAWLRVVIQGDRLMEQKSS